MKETEGVVTVKSVLRSPSDAEAQTCAQLLYKSGPSLFAYLYLKDGSELVDFLKFCILSRKHTFSLQNIIVDVSNGDVRGLIAGVPVKDLRKSACKVL